MSGFVTISINAIPSGNVRRKGYDDGNNRVHTGTVKVDVTERLVNVVDGFPRVLYTR